MTITQMECFVEAAKTLNFTKAAENLYISQQVMSRQIKSLEKELGFPVFERKNTGVRLTQAGAILFMEWRSLLEQYRSSVDKALDLYYGEQKSVRIGVSDLGNIVSKVSRALIAFNEKYPDLSVEYMVDTFPRMREEMEEGRLHMIITFGVETIPEKDWHRISVDQSKFTAGVVLNKKHPCNTGENVTYKDIQYETIGVLSDRISFDHRTRVQNEFIRHEIFHTLNFREFDSFSNLQIALATGRCVGILYERIMDGMEDTLDFYPVDFQEHDGNEVMIAWKNEKYATKAKNIAELMETQVL